MSLYQIWLEARKKGAICEEWKLAHNFLTWATANGYKPEYGYKGKFTPENLLAAVPKMGCDLASGLDMTVIGDKIIINEPKKEIGRFAAAMTTGAFDVETLSKMKVPELKELADKMEIDLKGITRKDDIVKAIAEAGNEEFA